MPVMDGITAVREIMKVAPTPILMFSSLTHEGAKATLDALDAGALDFLPKKFEDIARNREEAVLLLQKRIVELSHKRRFMRRPVSSTLTSGLAHTSRTSATTRLSDTARSHISSSALSTSHSNLRTTKPTVAATTSANSARVQVAKPHITEHSVPASANKPMMRFKASGKKISVGCNRYLNRRTSCSTENFDQVACTFSITDCADSTYAFNIYPCVCCSLR